MTARCAAEQNRDLYAVPGNVTNKNSWTPNTLIKQGAKLVASWEDVWEDLPSQVRLQLEAAGRGLNPNRRLLHLFCRTRCCDQKRRWCLQVLRTDESLQIDEIARTAGDSTYLVRGVYGSI